jgi:hypothetical protein
MNRTLNVIRMQLVNTQTYVWVPLIVLGGSLVISLAIYAIIHSAGVDTPIYGGGAQAPLWYFGVVGVQALTLTFPFSQAMSVTRREFYLGTLATAALTSAVLAAVFVVGGLVELATDGWGLNGYFFHLPWLWEAGPLGAAIVYFAVAMAFFVLGFWAATLYKRFGTVIVTTILLGIAGVLVLVAFLLTINDGWPALWEGLAALGALGLALWGLVLLAGLAASSFYTLRRAVP